MVGRSSFVAESNFNPAFDNKIINDLKNKYNFDAIQLLFKCDGALLFERFKNRAESDERHPGHRDHLNYDEFREMLLRGRAEPLDIGSKLIEIDTTDFEKIHYDDIFEKLRRI